MITYKEYLELKARYGITKSARQALAHDTKRLDSIAPNIQEKIFAWIKANVSPSQKIFMGTNSYSMKHVLEKRTGLYMTNNQYKEAMLRCGFFPVDSQELNWLYRILKTSPIYVRQEDGKRGLYIPECVIIRRPSLM